MLTNLTQNLTTGQRDYHRQRAVTSTTVRKKVPAGILKPCGRVFKVSKKRENIVRPRSWLGNHDVKKKRMSKMRSRRGAIAKIKNTLGAGYALKNEVLLLFITRIEKGTNEEICASLLRRLVGMPICRFADWLPFGIFLLVSL